ncbi:MAG: carbon storage regulator [Planctomycetia bacterium]|nr:carbon storage regulator [Planctomycetia bacterium]
MLVLSRRQGEKIVIDGRITVVVSQLKGGRVRIAIEAPPEVSILRGELQSRRDEEPRIVLSHVG